MYLLPFFNLYTVVCDSNLSHLSMNHCSKVTQLANPLISMLQIALLKAGAETLMKQWKKKISLRQILRKKNSCWVSCILMITWFYLECLQVQKSMNDSWSYTFCCSNITYLEKGKGNRVDQQSHGGSVLRCVYFNLLFFLLTKKLIVFLT